MNPQKNKEELIVLKKEYKKIEEKLALGSAVNNHETLKEYSKRYRELRTLITSLEELENIEKKN